MEAPHLSGAYFKLNCMNKMQATIDMAGLPDALAFDLKNQMEAMVEKARADLPISFQDRIVMAVDALPCSGITELVTYEEVATTFKEQLEAHIDKLQLEDQICNLATNCVNWNAEEYSDEQFARELRKILDQFFI